MLRLFPAFKILFVRNRSIITSLRRVLGFYPTKLSLYSIAFTHKSASFSINGEKVNNERLEFLGDSILDAIISDYLYEKYPFEKEGFLTEMRSKIVNGDKLQELATLIHLDSFIILNNVSPKGKTRVFEDAFEAFIGAIYLDKGYKTTYNFVINNIIKKHIDLESLEKVNLNYKSQLIEWAQKFKRELKFGSFEDPEHYKQFIAEIIVDEEIISTAKGPSKKEAEQKAAQKALKLLS
ncbi:MAG: ribonuclease III [Bacteroidales bacterium]|nr:ribonuclease III [Bacteroidales bacterium]MBN2756601.1 ribonuclease III [Bacteroidales bacterium]